MTSTYHHIAQARITLLTLGEAPHATLLTSQATALDELRAAAQETEKLARIHPATMLKEAAIGGFSALSLLSVFVLGRSLALMYAQIRAQISGIQIPFVDVSAQTSRILPPMPLLDQIAKLPEMTWAQAIAASVAVAVVILLYHIVKSFLLLRRERLLAHSAKALAAASHVIRQAAAVGSREDALALLAKAMEDVAP
ncbi:hypothetical protein EPO33_04605 [Patescibacteria group bacterium]|nr:MAG: hypothetical protein EPO33_04605 [Patescibacteria group bacterium]